MKQQYFITAPGTGIGKTYVATMLCRGLRLIDKSVYCMKPVITGFSIADKFSDTALIIDSLGLEFNLDNVEKISKFRFSQPLSPDIAAAQEGKIIEFQRILAEYRIAAAQQYDYLLIEAGGVLTPLTDTHTMLDLPASLNIPVIFVIGSYLGTISHTLSAIAALEQRNISIYKIIMSESLDAPCSMTETIKSIKNFTDHTIIPLARKQKSPFNCALNNNEAKELVKALWK